MNRKFSFFALHVLIIILTQLSNLGLGHSMGHFGVVRLALLTLLLKIFFMQRHLSKTKSLLKNAASNTT